MCRRILGLLLFGFFTFVVVTVAAFVYLDWWQALLVSGFTFLFEIAVARALFLTAVGKFGNLAKVLFETKSVVLRGATVQVHSVHPVEVPASVAEQLTALPPADGDDPDEETRADAERVRALIRDAKWFEVEVTIFPADGGKSPMTHWDIDDLRLVPTDAKPLSWKDQDEADEESELSLHDLEVIEDGVAVRPEQSKFAGPQRLRFRVGVPKTLREAKFQYYFEQFGKVAFPGAAR